MFLAIEMAFLNASPFSRGGKVSFGRGRKEETLREKRSAGIYLLFKQTGMVDTGLPRGTSFPPI